MFKEESESFGSLTRRVGLNAYGSAANEGARAVPKPFEYLFEDGEVIDAGGENTPQAEKDLVTIGCVDYA